MELSIQTNVLKQQKIFSLLTNPNMEFTNLLLSNKDNITWPLL